MAIHYPAVYYFELKNALKRMICFAPICLTNIAGIHERIDPVLYWFQFYRLV